MPSNRVLYMLCLVALIGGLLLLYAHFNSDRVAVPIGKVVQIPAPLGLPPVPIPALAHSDPNPESRTHLESDRQVASEGLA